MVAHRAKRFSVWIACSFLVLVATALTGIWWGGRIEVARLRIPLDRVNAPFRLAALSDIHIGAGGRRMERWQRALALVEKEQYGSRYPHGLRREGRTWDYVTKDVPAGNRLPRWFNAREVVVIEVLGATQS